METAAAPSPPTHQLSPLVPESVPSGGVPPSPLPQCLHGWVSPTKAMQQHAATGDGLSHYSVTSPLFACGPPQCVRVDCGVFECVCMQTLFFIPIAKRFKRSPGQNQMRETWIMIHFRFR